ncbi:hypothetical protein F4212_13250 [Candidatus Poribacteria bacterium]|nr:hypothetical protein [Candidatus Poribacteria bacterium]
MKILPHITLTLILIIITPTFAQETNKGFKLPEGASARLGKGRMNTQAIEYTQDGTRLVVATSIGIWLYDTINFTEIDLLTKHSTRPEFLTVSPQGNMMASVDTNMIIYLWDTTGTYKRGIRNDEGIHQIIFSGDGQTIATLGHSGTVRLLDPNTSEVKLVSEELVDFGAQGVFSFALNPDNLLLAIGDRNGLITIIDVFAGKTKYTLKGHDNTVVSLAFSSDDRTLASGSRDSIRLWDVETEEPKQIIEHTGTNKRITFSPDSSLFASSDRDNIRVWDVNTGEQRQLLKGHTASILDISFSSDLRTVASASNDGTVRIWNVNSGKQLHAFNNHFGTFTCFAISTDSKTVVAPTIDQTVCLWDISSGKLVKTFNKEGYYDITEAAFNPTDDIIAFASYGNFISLWNREIGGLMKTLKGHKDYVLSVAFSPDGKTIASGSTDKTVRLWDTETLKEKRVLEGHEAYVLSVAFSPDGTTIASASHDKTIRLWDVETGDIKKVLKKYEIEVYDVAFSPDGTTIASADRTMFVHLWDTKTGEYTRFVVVESPGARCIDFSPNSKVLAIGNLSGAVQLIDVDTGKSLHVFRGHRKRVTHIAFASDGDKVISRSHDGILYVWDVTAID